MLAGAAAGFGEMLSPMQLLWINLISDVLPAIGLAMEPPEPDAMERGPTDANEPMVRRDQMGRLGDRSRDSDRERLRGRALRGHAVRAELAPGAHPRLREPGHRPASARACVPFVQPERIRARRALWEPAASWDHRRLACGAARGHAGTRRAQCARRRAHRAPGCHGDGRGRPCAISHQRGGASQRNGPGRVRGAAFPQAGAGASSGGGARPSEPGHPARAAGRSRGGYSATATRSIGSGASRCRSALAARTTAATTQSMSCAPSCLVASATRSLMRTAAKPMVPVGEE